MKKFLIISASLLVFALLAVVVIFFTVIQYMSTKSDRTPLPASTTTAIREVVFSTASTSKNKIPDTGLPLSDISLSEKQESVAKAVGINPDTFVITKEMYQCVVDKVGDVRVGEIIAGDTPSAIEVAKLSFCLGS
jgi:hypothetical protein